MTPPDPLWTPTAEFKQRTNLWRFLAAQGLDPDDYDAAWTWSVADLDRFWRALVEFAAVRWETPPERMLADARMPGAVWCPGARLNYAEHIFGDRDPATVALQHASELRELRSMTWGELRRLTARVAAGLRAVGVGPGDRVVGYLPNTPEALAGLLAAASLGAVWSSCSPDFGARSVVDRFAQIEPTVLLAVDGYRYGGRDFDRRETVAGLMERMPSLRQTVLVDYLGAGPLDGTTSWADFLGPADAELEFTPVAFEHPLWVLYSSGTTGIPKAIVQSQGGILIEQLKKMLLHLDAQAGDRVFWFTTTGWMMWNFLVGVLLTDAQIILYDGNPGTPDLSRLWELAADTGMTCLGTSAAFITACMKADVTPAQGRDLSALRSVGSTGSPLPPEGFSWIYDQLGGETWLFSTSGGTDVCTAFVGGCPLLPVYRGELQCRALACDVHAYDPDGRDLVGAVGELVITQPMPSMPVFFWDDPDGRRLHEAYFDTYPGVWRHGDWIEITERGTAVISGRSDSTINRGGIRMGTSEIYRAVLEADEITDALVVDVPQDDGDSWMPLFVVLREGATLDGGTVAAIGRRVREYCSPRHVPSEVIAIDEVPRTLSGKVLEIPVKRILMGTPPERAVARDALANPAALETFVELGRVRARA